MIKSENLFASSTNTQNQEIALPSKLRDHLVRIYFDKETLVKKEHIRVKFGVSLGLI